MALIFAKDGQIPGPVSLSIDQGDDRTFLLDIVCQDGYFLSAVPAADVAVEARRTDADDWTDIAAEPIDLAAYAPNVVEFQFRLTVDADAAIDPENVFRTPRIRVSTNP